MVSDTSLVSGSLTTPSRLHRDPASLQQFCSRWFCLCSPVDRPAACQTAVSSVVGRRATPRPHRSATEAIQRPYQSRPASKTPSSQHREAPAVLLSRQSTPLRGSRAASQRKAPVCAATLTWSSPARRYEHQSPAQVSKSPRCVTVVAVVDRCARSSDVSSSRHISDHLETLRLVTGELSRVAALPADRTDVISSLLHHSRIRQRQMQCCFSN
jgi:hypothetical protein